MEEQIVAYDTAVLAKEKGFGEKCIFAYNEYGTLDSCIDQTGELYFTKEDIDSAGENDVDCYLAPTQSLLQKWLREKHKIHITITSISQESWQCHITKIGESLGTLVFEDFYTYEEALEEVLLKSLNLIK